MTFYRDLDPNDKDDKRTLQRLQRLRKQFRGELPNDPGIPPRTLSETLLLATWNIRDFDKPTFGQRSNEAIHYIAEIIEQFDLVALQEVYRDLSGLHRVMRILGPSWDYLSSDTTEGSSGNSERLVFLYDTRKVQLGNVVSEVVLPATRDKNGNTVQPGRQLSRTPYLVGFRAGWSRFMLATVHIDWGASKAVPQRRVDEIANLANFLAKRSEDQTAWSRNIVLLGDFNIWDPKDATMKALTNAGFEIPAELMNKPSNAGRNRNYDQIAFRADPSRLAPTGRAGVFDFYKSVFTMDDHPGVYNPLKADGTPSTNPRRYYRNPWRTHQMSDHLPMWCELQVDYADEYIQRKLDHNA